VWLAKLAERGMIRPSFIPGRPQRQLRNLTRYRRTLTHERTREMQRAEKLLEDAQVKLSSVISSIFGTSGRDMLAALIAGQRDPHALAALARGKMRAKTSVLQEALTGHFTERHAFLLAMMLARIDALTAQIDTLTTRIEQSVQADLGWNSSTGLPDGSSRRTCRPAGPSTISPRNDASSALRFSTVASRSSTTIWKRFHPPGVGSPPALPAPPTPGSWRSNRRSPLAKPAKPGAEGRSTWKPSRAQ
jgi:hypothetical protein